MNISAAYLFKQNQSVQPLADKLRPEALEELFGQDNLLKQITQMLESGQIRSLILWGPPGSGKTTLAKIIAKKSNCHFESASAVVNNTADIKHIFASASERKNLGGCTILLVDEIHRFNRTQQDIFWVQPPNDVKLGNAYVT